ncbi:Hypothetical predicted protein [Olea europaea subsp. europaea]|uniref:Uncharacterized protein n=1 Tax=Olea europaea subsp. europaea TaxID=158383 RepID=A0A8S0RBL8_OLEEU|nr:Hypothetical predicted protein [Olea europaea subsp. europaea]
MKHRPRPKNLSSDDGAAVSSSEALIPMTSPMASSSLSHMVLSIEKPSVAVEDHSRDAGATAASTTASKSVVVELRADYSALCKVTHRPFRATSPSIYKLWTLATLPPLNGTVLLATVLPLKIPRIPQSLGTGIAGTGFRPRRSLMGGGFRLLISS